MDLGNERYVYRGQGRENEQEAEGVVDGAHGTVVAAVITSLMGGFGLW